MGSENCTVATPKNRNHIFRYSKHTLIGVLFECNNIEFRLTSFVIIKLNAGIFALSGLADFKSCCRLAGGVLIVCCESNPQRKFSGIEKWGRVRGRNPSVLWLRLPGNCVSKLFIPATGPLPPSPYTLEKKRVEMGFRFDSCCSARACGPAREFKQIRDAA